MPHHTGLEALVQRGRSDLYKDLVSLYQESFHALSEAYTASDDDVYIALKTMDFIPRLKAIVQTHMGITLASVSLVPGKAPNMMISCPSPKLPYRNIQTLTSGTIQAAIANYYNDHTGTFDKIIKTQKIMRYRLAMTTSFWLIRNPDNSFYYTADEMAAIILHELGHIDWWTRQALHGYATILDANDIVTYVKAHPDRAVILDLIDHIEKSVYFDKSWKPVVTAARDYFTNSLTTDDAVFNEAISTLSLLVSSETASRNLSTISNLVDDRFAKMPSTAAHLDAERSADEFASRHGAYSANASEVKKGGALDTTHAALVFKPFMGTPAAFAATLLTTFITLFYLPSENVKNGYDPLIARMSLILETAKHAFADPNLPEEVKADIKVQIAEIETCINQAQSSTHYQIRKVIKQWRDTIASFGRIVKTPIDNRLTKDYGKLQDATRHLGRHPLYYLADKHK